MSTIRLPIDVKSLYFNIKNDNLTGHTPTVASPIKKVDGNDKLEDILLLKEKEIDISSKDDLIELLIKHSKSKVVIKNLFVFNNFSVNGKRFYVDYSFGCYVKEEIDDTKARYGRQKLHYPPKLDYVDMELNINNKKVYEALSNQLNNYAFIVQAFEYNTDEDLLNFDVLIVGENDIPYSKVFINEKGVGNKFNMIFNESADDYDKEIIVLRKKYGENVNPYNYLEYMRSIKNDAFNIVKEYLGKQLYLVSDQYPYSLFDFYYLDNKIKKYGILRTTVTRNRYFNISLMQKSFMNNNNDDVCLFLVTNALECPKLSIYDLEKINELSMVINSIRYEEDIS